MICAAVDEWAEFNNVTLSYDSDYNSSAILDAIDTGERIGLLIVRIQVPIASIIGITKAFSQGQYDQIAKICSKQYLGKMNYKGESQGLVCPWSDCTFNRAISTISLVSSLPIVAQSKIVWMSKNNSLYARQLAIV